MNTTTAIFVSVPGKAVHPANKVRPRSYIDRKKTYFLLKRIIDITVSALIILTVLSWLIPLAAILIKLDSRGPVLFLQKRVGRGGRTFTCLKLRTMIVNGVSDTRASAPNDDRITKMGRWLRMLNVDEFPQFINVLLGHMSLVGPRPHMFADCYRFSSYVNGYKFRHFVKPGITGLAQVKGYHGPAPDSESIVNRYQCDAWYICHAGIGLDMRILLDTVVQELRMIFPANTIERDL
jgi:putative colanic acid biosysnthesis UDP-glucose lipid carrier transferase